jgi:hypothetical protein
VTGEAKRTLQVLLVDEDSAGRICADLDAFVRFNESLSRQIRQLEARIGGLVPQLAHRGKAGGGRSSIGDSARG